MRRGEAAEHKSCHSTAAEWGQQRWQLNFPSNKAPVFMQISLRNEIPAKRKADNVLCKQNYLGTDGFFQGFGVYPWGFFSVYFGALSVSVGAREGMAEQEFITHKAPLD